MALCRLSRIDNHLLALIQKRNASGRLSVAGFRKTLQFVNLIYFTSLCGGDREDSEKYHDYAPPKPVDFVDFDGSCQRPGPCACAINVSAVPIRSLHARPQGGVTSSLSTYSGFDIYTYALRPRYCGLGIRTYSLSFSVHVNLSYIEENIELLRDMAPNLPPLQRQPSASTLSTAPTRSQTFDDRAKMQGLDRLATRRTLERHETRPTQDGSDVLDLPYGMLTDDADMQEYLEETTTGVIAKRTISRVSGIYEDHELVTFTVRDPENPKNWSKAYKWYCTMTVAFTCFVVAFCSAVITADLEGPSKAFNVSKEVSLLTITLFVIGFGVGKFRHQQLVAFII
jgi:hypothetical protein